MKSLLVAILFVCSNVFAGSFCIVSVPNDSCPAGNIPTNFPQSNQHDMCCKNMNGPNGVSASECYFPTPNAQGNLIPFSSMNECKRATPSTNTGGPTTIQYCASSKLCTISTESACNSTNGCYWFPPQSMCCAE